MERSRARARLNRWSARWSAGWRVALSEVTTGQGRRASQRRLFLVASCGMRKRRQRALRCEQEWTACNDKVRQRIIAERRRDGFGEKGELETCMKPLTRDGAIGAICESSARLCDQVHMIANNTSLLARLRCTGLVSPPPACPTEGLEPERDADDDAPCRAGGLSLTNLTGSSTSHHDDGLQRGLVGGCAEMSFRAWAALNHVPWRLQ